jgi:hypothetical protein
MKSCILFFLLIILIIVKVNTDELKIVLKTFNSSEYDRPFLFAHRYKTGGSNFMSLLNVFCGQYKLKCASSYSNDDGFEDERKPGSRNIHVLNHSAAMEYDIIGGHFVRSDFAKRYLGIYSIIIIYYYFIIIINIRSKG